MPGVDPPLASLPVRPPVEPEPSLAPASKAASERTLPALFSQGLRALISMDFNVSWPYLRLLFELYAPLCGFLAYEVVVTSAIVKRVVVACAALPARGTRTAQ